MKNLSSPLTQILDLARWAPSNGNTQPWRFEVIDNDRIIIHLLTAKARSKEDFYDYDNGIPTLLAGGTLLETIHIAAGQYDRGFSWSYEGEKNGIHKIAVTLSPDSAIKPDTLANFIETRSVNRHLYRMTPLSAAQKQALANALGDEFTISWHESLMQRWNQAINNAMATDIRLRIPEAFATHKAVVDWKQKFSPSRIPVESMGMDPISRALLRWFMKDWRRADLTNRYAGGSLLAQMEMGLLPGLFCAGHFIIHYKNQTDTSPEKYLRTGQAIQRFWLTATTLGLGMQPSYATLIFGLFGQRCDSFTSNPDMIAKAIRLAQRITIQTSKEPDQIAFIGRMGTPRHQT